MRKWVLLAALVMCCSLAKADITVEVLTVTNDPVAGNFLWTYEASLSDDARLDSTDDDPADFFTIYDFAGFVDGSIDVTLAPGWTGFSTNVGVDVPGTSPGTPPYPGDAPAITNLVFVWEGGLLAAPGPVGLFSARSTFGQSTNQSSYVGQSTNNTGRPGIDGDAMGNIGTVDTPGDIGEPPIPEPGTMGLMGSALLGLGALRLRRK
jgi:hypothetical protein